MGNLGSPSTSSNSIHGKEMAFFTCKIRTKPKFFFPFWKTGILPYISSLFDNVSLKNHYLFSYVKAKPAVSTIFFSLHPDRGQRPLLAQMHHQPDSAQFGINNDFNQTVILLHGGKYALIQLPKCLNCLALWKAKFKMGVFGKEDSPDKKHVLKRKQK